MKTKAHPKAVEASAQGDMQKALQDARKMGQRGMRAFAERCLEERNYGLAGRIYEELGRNRNAAAIYLMGEELTELRRMIDEGKLIRVKWRAQKALEIAVRQLDWNAAEGWAKLAAQGRSTGRLTKEELAVEVERRISEAIALVRGHSDWVHGS